MTIEQLRAQKISMFSERESMDAMIEYASQIAGAEGSTIAMMTYNTLLEILAQREEQAIK